MQELVISSWCDICWSNDRTRTKSTWSVDYSVRPSDIDLNKRTNNTVDLCEEHHKEVMRGYLSLGRGLSDNKPRKIEPSEERSKYHSDRPVIPCPVCDKSYTRGPGLSLHVKRYHPEVDKAELRRYTDKVMEDLAIAKGITT